MLSALLRVGNCLSRILLQNTYILFFIDIYSSTNIS